VRPAIGPAGLATRDRSDPGRDDPARGIEPDRTRSAGRAARTGRTPISALAPVSAGNDADFRRLRGSPREFAAYKRR
jgi:hypothetical protein